MELLVLAIGVMLAIFTPLTLTTCYVLMGVVLFAIWGVRLYRAPMTRAEGTQWLLSFALLSGGSAVGWWWGGGWGRVEASHLWLSTLTGFLGAMVGLFAERRRARKRMVPA